MNDAPKTECVLCGLTVAATERAHTRMTSEGPRLVHERCAGQQVRNGGTHA